MIKVYFNLVLACLLMCASQSFNSLQAQCADPNGLITVTNTLDAGDGSLRAAIECANSTAGANTIYFDIAGLGPHIIQVGSTSGLDLPRTNANNAPSRVFSPEYRNSGSGIKRNSCRSLRSTI